MALSPTGVSTGIAQTGATSTPPQDARLYAASLIQQYGGATRPDYGKIVGQLEALLQNADPAVQEFGHAVEREVVSQLSGGKAVKAAQVEKALYIATYTSGGESFSRSGKTIDQTRALAAKSPNANNPDFVKYMQYDRQHGDGKWATNDSAKINDVWRSMIASGAKTPAEYTSLAKAMNTALDGAITNWQTQFSPGNIKSSVGDSLLRGLVQSERLSGTDMAQDIGLLLRKGPEMQLAFQVGVVKGVAGAAWGMVTSLAGLAGKAIQYGGDTIGFGIAGQIGDAARGAIPDWIKDGLNAVGVGQVFDAATPSYTRGFASTKALNVMGEKVKTYFATHSAEQMGQDVLGALEKKWDSLKGEFNALNGDPVKQAEWLGEKAGAVLFEVASTVVPITKLGTAAKMADKAGDVARGLDKLYDVADAGRAAGKAGTEVAETLLSRAQRIIGDLPLNSKSLDDLYKVGKLTMDEARELAAKAGFKDIKGEWIYPPNQGFSTVPKSITIKKGDQFLMDRYGHPGGKFTSPLGESYGARALPPGSQKLEFHVYKVAEDVNVLAGKATPWFNELGGAIQYKLPERISDLAFDGILVELKR
jgi:hypothetical protein